MPDKILDQEITGASVSGGEVERALVRWEQEQRRIRRRRLIFSLCNLVVLVGFGFVALRSRFNLAVGLCVWLMMWVAKGLEAWFDRWNAPTQQSALEDLAASADVSAIGPLTAALERAHSGSQLYNATATALTRLLPQLTPDEARQVFCAHRSVFCACVSNRTALYYPDLVIAILHLMSHTSDREALAQAARLIVDDAPSRNGQRARDAARAGFPGLLASVDLGTTADLVGWIRCFGDSARVRTTWEGFILPRLAIMKLLPQMSAPEFLKLNPQDRRRLYQAIITDSYYDSAIQLTRLGPGYAMAVLDMATRAQDIEALATVRSISYDNLGVPKVVRDIARECLPVLEAAARQGRVGRTLLRASSAPEDAVDTLLRPASESPDADPKQLLRANVQQDRET